MSHNTCSVGDAMELLVLTSMWKSYKMMAVGQAKGSEKWSQPRASFVNSATVLSLMFGIRSSLLTVYGFTIDWEFAVWENEDLYNARLNKWWIIDLADLTTLTCKYHRMFYSGSNLVSWASWSLLAFYYKGQVPSDFHMQQKKNKNKKK